MIARGNSNHREIVRLDRRRLSMALALSVAGCEQRTNSSGEVVRGPDIAQVGGFVFSLVAFLSDSPLVSALCFLRICLAAKDLIDQGLAWDEAGPTPGSRIVGIKAANQGVEARLDASPGVEPTSAIFVTPATDDQTPRRFDFNPKGFMALAQIPQGDVQRLQDFDVALNKDFSDCTEAVMQSSETNIQRMRAMRSECIAQRIRDSSFADYFDIKHRAYAKRSHAV